jgi:exodeoxyribonuclease VII large subunit
VLWVEGELSNLARPSSGHWYFTLKDKNAQIRCAMFRNRNRGVSFQPEGGQQILVRGRISLYENRGDYQLIAEHIEPAGLGALQRQYELLKAKLAGEGLFDEQYKLPVPQFPEHLAVITSPTGAAIRDVLHVVKQRFPALPITIYPTPVQGPEAATGIIKALALANTRADCDLIILTRGGGSLEDLWPFNEELVARAIADSSIPVISAVGHETDSTISDYVADARAATPSAAAALASPNGSELSELFSAYVNRFYQLSTTTLAALVEALGHLRKRLRHPGETLNKQGQHLDHLEIRLINGVQLQLQSHQLRLENLLTRFMGQAPQAKLAQLSDRVLFNQERLYTAIKHVLAAKNDEFSAMTGLLQAVSPLNTLDRGYAIVQDQREKLITHTADTKQSDQITVTITDGVLDCEVLRIRVQDDEKND